MNLGAAHFISYALTHGYHVWAEIHWYYQNHSRGGWVEWLAR